MLMKPLTVADLTSSSPSKFAMLNTSTPVVSQREVTCIAAYGIGLTNNTLSSTSTANTNETPILLAVGRKDGTLDKFDLVTGQYLVSFKYSTSSISNLLSLRRFGCLASVQYDKNILTIWDIQADRTVQLDFTSELESMGRKLSKLSFATYDDYRGVIMIGDDAGSVYVRSINRIAETNDLAVKLVRIAAPAPTASAPTRVTAMYYDTKVDVMFTGDASGLCRLVPKATGIAFKSIPENERNEIMKNSNGILYNTLLNTPWNTRITEIQTSTLVQLKNAITALNNQKASTLTLGKKGSSPLTNSNKPTTNTVNTSPSSVPFTGTTTNTVTPNTPIAPPPTTTITAPMSAVSITSNATTFMSPTSPTLPYPETPTTVKKAVLFTSPDESVSVSSSNINEVIDNHDNTHTKDESKIDQDSTAQESQPSPQNVENNITTPETITTNIEQSSENIPVITDQESVESNVPTTENTIINTENEDTTTTTTATTDDI